MRVKRKKVGKERRGKVRKRKNENDERKGRSETGLKVKKMDRRK